MSVEIRKPVKIEHPEIGSIQFEIVNNEEYCGKVFIQKDGTTTPAHSHKSKHETFLVWSGTLAMIVDGEEYAMSPGDVISIDRGVEHEFTAIAGDAVFFEFSTSSSPNDSYFTADGDWQKVNRRIVEPDSYEWPF